MYIETKNLILRPFRPNDYLDLYEYLHEPGSPCFIDMKLDTLEDAKKSLEEIRKNQKEANRKFSMDFSEMERDLELNLKKIQASKL